MAGKNFLQGATVKLRLEKNLGTLKRTIKTTRMLIMHPCGITERGRGQQTASGAS